MAVLVNILTSGLCFKERFRIEISPSSSAPTTVVLKSSPASTTKVSLLTLSFSELLPVFFFFLSYNVLEKLMPSDPIIADTQAEDGKTRHMKQG